MEDKIINKLRYSLKDSHKYKSSYWKNLKYSEDLDDIYGHFGFGTFEKKTFIRNLAHTFFQYLIYGKNLFKMSEFKILKNFYDKFNRQIDIDSIKHVFTFNFLKNKIGNPQSISVIGDGKANFVTCAYLNYPHSKIFSINLPEVLIHDYLILKEYKIFREDEISVVTNEKDLEGSQKRLFLVSPDKVDLLQNIKVDFYANLCSFQEIKFDDIIKYFEIIKKHKALFYCCNRRSKILPGGENIVFQDYPWGKGKNIVEGQCEWIKKIYFFRPPFIKSYDGPHDHKLISYNDR